MEKLLRMDEVARATGIPVNTLRNWRHKDATAQREGRPVTGPKSARLGGRVVYREADVKAWVDEQFERGA